MRDTFASLFHTQVANLHPHKCFENIYPLLNVLKPIALDEPTRMALKSVKFHVPDDSRIRHELFHQLVCQVTNHGVAVISAMGGMGKSTIAKQFAQFMMGTMDQDPTCPTCPIRKPQYEHVFFVCCSTEAQALADLESICQAKGEALETEANAFFEDQHRYLVILDNLDDIQLAEKIFKMDKFGGDVLITTRLDSLPVGKFASMLIKSSGFLSTKLEPWSLESTKLFILNNCPSLGKSLQDQDELKAFESIVSKIDGFPLVIQQLISCLNNEVQSLTDLEAQFSDLLHNTRNEGICLRAIINIALQALGNDGVGQAATLLFYGAGFLDASNIQLKLLDKLLATLKELGICDKAVKRQHVVKKLVDVGLMRRLTSSSLYTHSLMQEVSKELSAEHKPIMKKLMGSAVLEVLGSDPYDAFQLEIGLHVHHLAESHSLQLPYATSLEIEIDRTSGLLFIYKGYFKKAREVLEACAVRSEAFHKTRTHPDFALTLNKLGNCANAQYHFEVAVPIYHEALEIYETIYGRKHETVATILRCLGMVSNSQGNGEMGQIRLLESVDTFRQIHGSHSKDVAASLNNLGVSYSLQKQFSKAMDCYQESVTIKVEVYGTKLHPSIATNLYNIGRLALLKGDLENAEKALEECRHIRESVFNDKRHPEYAMVLEELGDIFTVQGREEDACEAYAEVYSVYCEVYGDSEVRSLRVQDKKQALSKKSTSRCIVM
ncbi:hypothetical protein HDU98_010950 [Podochytrium sp. JEL0797]|nr:hypothetical protein HDU98_010950 [Podochytrium sp. JEL0797]